MTFRAVQSMESEGVEPPPVQLAGAGADAD